MAVDCFKKMQSIMYVVDFERVDVMELMSSIASMALRRWLSS